MALTPDRPGDGRARRDGREAVYGRQVRARVTPALYEDLRREAAARSGWGRDWTVSDVARERLRRAGRGTPHTKG